jgi:Protein of unknown function (DUF2799)
LSLSGCSSINSLLYKNTCTSNNWESVGEKDGEKAIKDASAWSGRCQQFGTTPDVAKYDKGYLKGLGKFCQMQGFDGGKKGTVPDLPGQCAEKNEKTRYEEGYDLGLHEFCTPDSGKQHALSGAERAQVCEKITPYQNGYAIGVKELCSSKVAFKTGLENKTFEAKSCAINMRPGLLAAFNRGKRLSDSRQKASALEAEINDLTKKVYDPAIPTDAKTHYQTIMDAKKTELKSVEKLIYGLENEERRL